MPAGLYMISETTVLLAEAGVHIKYNHNALWRAPAQELTIHNTFEPMVASLKLFPGISPAVVEAVLGIEGLQGLVIETFGAGNGRNEQWFEDLLKTAIDNGLVAVNISQCQGGSVEQGVYEASMHFQRAGVINGRDLTFEAAITKLMFVLEYAESREDAIRLFTTNLCGELSD